MNILDNKHSRSVMVSSKSFIENIMSLTTTITTVDNECGIYLPINNRYYNNPTIA